VEVTLRPAFLWRLFAVTLPSAGAAFGRVLTRRRHDDTTFNGGAFGAFTKNTKATEGHKENLESLFEGLSPLAGPRFARWQE
jgi:hypothetical protein